MSRSDGPATLRAVGHAFSPLGHDAWWLRILWRLTNPAGRPLHVLLRGPTAIRDGSTLVVDHTVAGQPDDVDWNVQPRMGFGVVAPAAQCEAEREYPLPPLGPSAELTIRARVSIGYEEPDPAWATGRIWQAVARWETVLESEPLILRSPGAGGSNRGERPAS